ncbi:MAG: DUF2332 domain-containing protein [Pseudonocardiales bacterium]|nr:DUF2332 domain-containing protein [Pseudonocardiales bacterium]
MSGDLDLGPVAAAFDAIATRRAAGGYAPIYARLAAGCATDPELLRIAAQAQPGQNPPSLLLGTAHYLLAQQPEHPLAAFYSAITGQPAPDPREQDPFPLLRDFLTTHQDQIAELVATRFVQTQEPGRAAYLYPALLLAQHLAAPDPLAVIEIGPSAGLTLVPDRYAYRYDTHPAGDPDSPLVLHCALRGGTPPLDQPLRITWRAGIDLNPLNLADSNDRAWLRAFIWPDHPDRADRLDRAIAAARRGPLPMLHRGAANQLLPRVLALAPGEATVCVYHTATTAHFTPDARRAHARQLATLARTRRLLWLQAEPRPANEPRLRITDLRDGQPLTEHLLGHYHPHGAWLHWLSTP